MSIGGAKLLLSGGGGLRTPLRYREKTVRSHQNREFRCWWSCLHKHRHRSSSPCGGRNLPLSLQIIDLLRGPTHRLNLRTEHYNNLVRYSGVRRQKIEYFSPRGRPLNSSWGCIPTARPLIVRDAP